MTDAADRLYEAILVLWCQAGDEAAFAELVERYQPRLRYSLGKMLRDGHRAEDALQEGWDMTEAGWRRCRDPSRMLESIRARAGRRRLWLLACACCRLAWDDLPAAACRRAVAAAEQFLRGEATAADLEAAARAAHRVANRLLKPQRDQDAATRRADAAWRVAGGDGLRGDTTSALDEAAMIAERSAADDDPGRQRANRARRCALIRDVFGNPFRPVAADPAWRTPAVIQLAAAAYETRALPAGTLDPVTLAVLADALEEAGCPDAEILGHLRGPGPHVWGCWAVDLLRGER